MCDHSFRPVKVRDEKHFFLRYGSCKPIVNATKEVDSLQRDFSLPSICSSNARHVVETLKGTAGLDATSSAGMISFYYARLNKVVASLMFYTFLTSVE